MPPAKETDVAYFSVEIAVDPAWPTFARGFGALAGDMLRSAADRGSGHRGRDSNSAPAIFPAASR
jgi:hypothetical protein